MKGNERAPERPLTRIVAWAITAALAALALLRAWGRPGATTPVAAPGSGAPAGATDASAAPSRRSTAAADAALAEEAVAEGAGARMSPERRQFLTKLLVGLGGAAAAAAGIPLVGFLLSPLLKDEPDFWRPVGAATEFASGTTVKVEFEDASAEAWAGIAGRTAAWLRHESGGDFIAFSINCTHLGCPVRWLADAALFMCPCHGGVFYADGSVAAGPPQQPLARYPVRVREGQVEIRTSPVPIT